MELLFVGAAAVVAWVAGAIWYWIFSVPRLRLSGVQADNAGHHPAGRPPPRLSAAQADNTGHPAGKSPLPYFIHGGLLLVVASTMRALFLRGGIEGLWTGLAIGVTLGALVVTPILLLSDIHPRRLRLALIDGGHAVLVCGLMGAILAAV